MSIKKGGASAITLHKSGEQWTVAERADYPADVSKLRKLLLALRDARIVEKKTSNPANFAVIGVEDPSQPGSTSSEVTVTAPQGALAVIVGKPAGEGNFVRRAGENQSFTVEPAISFETEPRYWIDSKLFNIPAAQIQSEQVKLSDGSSYTLHRAAAPDSPFVLDGVPPGRKALDAPALAPTPTSASDLTAEDVAPIADVDFKQAAQAVLTLTDGTVLTLTGVVVADKHWIQITSNKDAALNAKSQGRAIQIASYRYDAIFRPLEQLLVPKESPAPKVAPRTGAATQPASPAKKGPAGTAPASKAPAGKAPAASPTP